jgi:glycosyltransferase involved in cell wall biosynthesis
LIAVGLFSGFENSVLQERWNPAGAPAIYRLIERLDASSDDLNLVLLGRLRGIRHDTAIDRNVRLPPLRTTARVLAGAGAFPSWLGRLRTYLGEIRKFWHVRQICRHDRPDVLYVDRGNVVLGGLMARYSEVPVVLRMLGISPSTKVDIGTRGIYGLLQRFAYRSPFDLVICTEAGMGSEMWLPKLFLPDIPVRTLLNGVDEIDLNSPEPLALSDIPEDRTIILTVGRLEVRKQPLLFAAAIVDVLRKGLPVHAVIAGGGSLESELRQFISSSGYGNAFTITGELPHRLVGHAIARADVFVSLNTAGNLSNSVLEALKHGIATIVPPSQPQVGVDTVLDRLFPSDTLLRLSNSNDRKVLADAIEHLVENSLERKQRAHRTRTLANELLSNWNTRIDEEIRLIASVANSLNDPRVQREGASTC